LLEDQAAFCSSLLNLVWHTRVAISSSVKLGSSIYSYLFFVAGATTTRSKELSRISFGKVLYLLYGTYTNDLDQPFYFGLHDSWDRLYRIHSALTSKDFIESRKDPSNIKYFEMNKTSFLDIEWFNSFTPSIKVELE